MSADTRHLPRAYRPIARAAAARGWTVALRRAGHVVWRSPSGAVVVSGCSPSDRRALRNHLARLARAGLDTNGGTPMTTLGGKPECAVCGHVIRAWPHRATLTDGRAVHVTCRDQRPDVLAALEQPEGDDAA